MHRLHFKLQLIFISYCLLPGLVSFAQQATPPQGKFNGAVNIHATPLKTRSLPEYHRLPLTVEMWVKLPAEKNARYNLLVSNASGRGTGHWEIYSTPLQGLLNARVSGVEPSSLRTFVRITDDKWHYIAMTCDGKQLSLFVDGKPAGSQAVQSASEKAKPNGETFVGAESNYTAERSVNSLIDELRISNVIRDVSAVPDKAFKPDANTIGLWHFDEESGNRRTDASQKTNALAYSPGISSEWTPRSSKRPDAADWERETDDDWKDGRFNEMEKGPFLGVSMRVASMLGKNRGAYAAKGLAIRVGDQQEATVLFDRATMQLSAGWTGGFVHIPDRRFGLIRLPEVRGQVLFSTPSRPGWRKPSNVTANADSRWAPLPADWARYNRITNDGRRTFIRYSVGNSHVIETPWVESSEGLTALTRTIQIRAEGTQDRATAELVETLDGQLAKVGDVAMVSWTPAGQKNLVSAVALIADSNEASLKLDNQRAIIEFAGSPEIRRAKAIYWTGPTKDLDRFKHLVSRSKKPASLSRQVIHQAKHDTMTTKGVLGEEQPGKPFVVDTLTLPYDNSYKSIFYVTGVGFLPDGRVAISTIYGDVWTVNRSGESLDVLSWRRFASGMYQPLGLAIKNGKIHVLERGQITCLHDLNGDGKADVYENVYNGWETTGAGHAYDTGFKLAPDGSFFFFKGQAGPHCRESGCLVRVAPDAQSHEVFSTGFRHPIGLGMSPDGVVTGGDQQGNWMPATRIDQYRKGGFYGDMRTHHRKVPPSTYDPPICWLPQYVDNSAGGQITIPENTWGPLAGGTVHLSWGRCVPYLLLREMIGDQVQGGVVRIPCEKFLSGSITGAFNPADKHLYIAGLHGWQTAGEMDGCLQRVRYTGETVYLPTALNIVSDGVKIRFSQPLDKRSAEDPSNFSLEQWNYRYSQNYGSDHWSVADPNRMGHDLVKVESVELSPDGKSVHLRIADIKPVMQMKIDYRLKTRDGVFVTDTIHHTINAIPAP